MGTILCRPYYGDLISITETTLWRPNFDYIMETTYGDYIMETIFRNLIMETIYIIET